LCCEFLSECEDDVRLKNALNLSHSELEAGDGDCVTVALTTGVRDLACAATVARVCVTTGTATGFVGVTWREPGLLTTHNSNPVSTFQPPFQCFFKMNKTKVSARLTNAKREKITCEPIQTSSANAVYTKANTPMYEAVAIYVTTCVDQSTHISKDKYSESSADSI
jgi:hypothetical protein